MTNLLELFICREVLNKKLERLEKIGLSSSDTDIDKTIERLEKVFDLLEKKVEHYVDHQMSSDGWIKRET